MRYLLIGILVMVCGWVQAEAQTGCPAMPAGTLCITQAQGNQLFDAVNQLIAAKDAIAKLTAERSTDTVALAQALKIIEGWKTVDQINGMIILKYQDVVALYEKALKLSFDIIDRMEKQLNKGKSGWQKFLHVLERVVDVVVGIGIGRVVPI